MVRYSAEYLEKIFKGKAQVRISRTSKGDNKYANDAGYWTGGACNWGGSHNLREDCGTLERFFQKVEDLKTSSKDLKESSSKEEFEATKSRLIRQSEEIEKNLQAKTSDNTSIGGVCIIWSDYISFIESQLSPLRNQVKIFKEQLTKEKYRYIEELRLLKLEQRQIEQRMKDNKQKSSRIDISPEEKATLLLLIEEDSNLLKENLKKQKEIPASKLNFEPDKYVADLIEAMRKAVEKGGKPNSSNWKGNNNQTNSDDSDSEEDIPSEGARTVPNNNNQDDNQPTNWLQENWELLLIGSSLLTIFYFYYQNEKAE